MASYQVELISIQHVFQASGNADILSHLTEHALIRQPASREL